MVTVLSLPKTQTLEALSSLPTEILQTQTRMVVQGCQVPEWPPGGWWGSCAWPEKG